MCEVKIQTNVAALTMEPVMVETILCCGNTLQVEDYSQYNWTIFEPKEKNHDETFGRYLEKAFEMAKNK